MTIKIEILQYSYWEHFKALKDISLILPIEHPKRKELQQATNNILNELHELKRSGSSSGKPNN